MDNPFRKVTDEHPHRLVLRRGDFFYRMLDIEIKPESAGSMSIYIKPPHEHLYNSVKPEGKHTLPKQGPLSVSFDKDVTKGSTYYNPYLSWHGSGKLHANAYSTSDLKKSIFLRDSSAVSLSDIGVRPHILFTLVLPLSEPSYGRTTAPPKEFEGNYIEISNSPYRTNETGRNGTAHIVFDQDSLLGGALILDVMVHNRGSNVGFGVSDLHPYPPNWEVRFVSHPIKINFNDLILPAVTLFPYQLATQEPEDIKTAEPIVFWGRSKNAQADQMFQIMLSENNIRNP